MGKNFSLDDNFIPHVCFFMCLVLQVKLSNRVSIIRHLGVLTILYLLITWVYREKHVKVSNSGKGFRES